MIGLVVGIFACLAPAGRGAVTIDPDASDFSAWTLVALSPTQTPSGFYTLPINPGTPDGGLPASFDHHFSYPVFTPFPTISSGTSSLRFTAGLAKLSGNNLITVTLNASATAAFRPGDGSQTPGYASGRARVTLRLTSAPGTRLRVTAAAEQAGGLCRFELAGTRDTYELRGTGSTEQVFLFDDGVARLEWIVHAEVGTDPLAPLNEPRASGSLLLALEELPPPGAVFSAHPEAATVTAGSPVTLHATAGAPAPITYQWIHDGHPIPGATGPEYVVPSAQRRDAGVYAVLATSEGVVVSSQAAVVAVNEPAPSPSRLLNLSTRGHTLTGDDVLIPGFVIAGTQPKRLLIRAVGPTLTGPLFGLTGVLVNPRLTLFRREGPGSIAIGGNDDWGDNPNAAVIESTSAHVGAFPLAGPLEAALLVELAPGGYTAIADGVSSATGVAVVELYDVDATSTDSRLINLSTRGHAGVGASVMIPGFVISSEGPKTVLIRVVGPALAAPPFDITGTMPDPKLTVYHRRPGGEEVPLFSSDDWGDFSTTAEISAAAGQVGAFALASGSKDAALVVTLAPGVYTVVGASADGVSTGIVLVEVYVMP